jgi:hypothetical protein
MELFIGDASILAQIDRHRRDTHRDAPYVVECSTAARNHLRFLREANRFARFLDEHALESVTSTDLRNNLWGKSGSHLYR